MRCASLTLLAALWIVAPLWGQQPAPHWQEDVRRCVEKHEWIAALGIVEREIERAPQDMDIRAWRARVLLWSGRVAEAQQEYLAITAAAPNDPDNWLGLANTYTREGQTKLAIEALDRALLLDPKRADIHAARARALRAQNQIREARLEFQKALELEPTSKEARAGVLSLRAPPKHELRIGSETDLFNFTGASHAEELRIISQWTPRWQTNAAIAAGRIAGIDAEKVFASVTGKSTKWGAFTLGGAGAHDNGIVPEHEFLFEYDRGVKLAAGSVRGIEFAYGQHWYTYSTAQILTLSQTATLYFPQGWTWSMGITEARSQFPGSGTEWRPSGTGRLGFPIVGGSEGRLQGNLFFAAGTENFALVNQIGRFSSQTYGGGLRLQVTERQDMKAVAAYQKRNEERTETIFSVNYGIRF